MVFYHKKLDQDQKLFWLLITYTIKLGLKWYNVTLQERKRKRERVCERVCVRESELERERERECKRERESE